MTQKERPKDQEETKEPSALEKPQDLLAEYVPAEANLEVIGYFDAGYKRRRPGEGKTRVKVINFGQGRTIRIVPTAEYGYPNTEDLDFYRAFLKICDEQVRLVERWKEGKKTIHPRLDLPIQFSTRKLIRYTGRKEGAREKKAVREWIKRQTHTGLEGTIYLAKKKGPVEGIFGGLFQMAFVRGEQMKNGKVAETNYVWPSGWFLSNYYYHYLKPIDLAFHRRLRKAIAKNLYPILDQGFYASKGQPFSKSYQDLAMLLSLPTHRHLSHIRHQLDPAHRELQREKFLAKWEYRKAADKLDFIITYWPGEKFFQDQQAREARRQLAEQITKKPEELPVAQPDLLNDRQHFLFSEIVALCGDEKQWGPAYWKAIKEHPEDLLWMTLSETKQADLEGRITKNKGAYFLDTLKRLAKLRATREAKEASSEEAMS